MSATPQKHCSKPVWKGSFRGHCARKALPGGTLCAMHTPEAEAARKKRLHEGWDRKANAAAERWAADNARREEERRKIEAFPDLLRELKHIVLLLEPHEADGSLAVPGLATLNGARLAIAKAEGR